MPEYASTIALTPHRLNPSIKAVASGITSAGVVPKGAVTDHRIGTLMCKSRTGALDMHDTDFRKLRANDLTKTIGSVESGKLMSTPAFSDIECGRVELANLDP